MKTKARSPLCCLVSDIERCTKCERPVCEDHELICTICGTVCKDCNRAPLSQCQAKHCGVELCRRCARDGRGGEVYCEFCYDEKERQYADY